jgi:hypothetical protein
VQEFERPKPIRLAKDSYFDGLTERLYPKEVAR